MLFMFFLILSDEESLLVDELFAKYNIKLYNIALGILQNKALAEEAVQDTFIKIIVNLHKIGQMPGPQREPYCVVIVKNISLNLLRKQKKSVPMDDVSYISYEDVQGAEQEFFKAEEIKILNKLLDTLLPEDKALLQMRWGMEMSFRQIGEILGIREETAKKRGQRAVGKLQKRYEKEGSLHG